MTAQQPAPQPGGRPLHLRVSSWALVFGGGAIGTGVRFAAESLQPYSHWPWATFVVNIVGSFALGAIGVLWVASPRTQLLLGTGFCGGLTTYSTFMLEARSLPIAESIGYCASTIIVGLVAAAGGMALANHWAGNGHSST